VCLLNKERRKRQRLTHIKRQIGEKKDCNLRQSHIPKGACENSLVGKKRVKVEAGCRKGLEKTGISVSNKEIDYTFPHKKGKGKGLL